MGIGQKAEVRHMESRFSVGMVYGMLLSIPLWISAIGWFRLVAQGITMFLKLRFA
ncbi:hypothetical protein KNP414_05877 [Paenibacillus mucilaginosus KNP414]|uniref:Uncharacterized protein n=1 Tax=Paenibacillus mucilaginosus (strain KNP414) TaxID=1036673 RepID=F8F9S2_PAEMK|nr:hypothetical protein KNP414_05877 [Paenibacillus mucilaginosus KNP414]